MKKLKYILSLSLITLIIMLFGFNTTTANESTTKNEGSILANTNNDFISMIDFATFLMDKKEHYPLSDEFVEKYQQTSGGYITYARELGLEVDKQKHEPNQKWHFFDSWLLESINDPSNTLEWDSDARVRVYNNLLSPELLLWIYEASGVSPEKVRNAKEVAEIGKVSKTHSATLAKNMRDIVSWEDIIANIDKDIIKASSVSLLDTLELVVGDENIKITATPNPTYTTDSATWSIVSGSEFININPNGNEVMVQAIKPGIAKIKVSYNEFIYAESIITVLEPDEIAIINLPNLIDFDLNDSLTLNPALNMEESDFSYESSNQEIVTVSNEGLITGISYGKTTITVKSIHYPELSKTIDVEVFDHGSKEAPLSVQNLLDLFKESNLSNNEFNSKALYIKGKVLEINQLKNEITLTDLTDNSLKVYVLDSINEEGVPKVSQNDIITIKGFIRIKNNKLFFDKKDNEEVQVLHNELGNSKVYLGEHDNVVVKVNDNLFNEPINIKNGSEFNFTLSPSEGFKIVSVTVNGIEIFETNNEYLFEVSGDSEIIIITRDSNIQTGTIAKYNIKFDLGTRKTSKPIDDLNELFEMFEFLSGEDNFILSISDMDKMYGGGYGGRGDTNWYEGDMLKFGTTSVNGSMTLELSGEINQIKITGYVSNKNAQIKVGDSNSSDWWENGLNDNKTTTKTLSEMNVASKEVVSDLEVVTITIDFPSTASLKISTINTMPLYITAIEFINQEEAK